jgi:tRNA/rRNA methyltransferase
MANFGLGKLRLVKPREAWPNPQARKMASGADRILDDAVLYDTVEDAIADCSLVLATTARQHDQAKPVIDAAQAAQDAAGPVAAGETVGILFGRERYGLENQEVALADKIVTLPVNPAFASLNLAQAVIIVAYEWFKHATAGALPFATPKRSPPASKQQLLTFFTTLERELEKVEFFRPPDKRDTMQINLRNIFTRMAPTQQDIRTLHGVVTAISEGRKGPARGGVLSGGEAEILRALLAEHGAGRVPNERGPVRGLARLLRRNPTEAERTFWEALTRDRRFAGLSFKRQIPVGPHITDIVSFPLKLAIELVAADENAALAGARSERRAWLAGRGYRVIDVAMADVETGVGRTLNELAAALGLPPSLEAARDGGHGMRRR